MTTVSLDIINYLALGISIALGSIFGEIGKDVYHQLRKNGKHFANRFNRRKKI